MNENFAEIDLSNQIDNVWNRDSVIALVTNTDKKYSIKIKNREKNLLRKEFIVEQKTKADKKHNKKVVIMIYSFLIYKILLLNRDILKEKDVLICRDERPERLVHSYLQRMASYFGNSDLLNNVRIHFRKRPIEDGIKMIISKSLANRHARDVFRGKKEENYCINNKDYTELKQFISKHL